MQECGRSRAVIRREYALWLSTYQHLPHVGCLRLLLNSLGPWVITDLADDDPSGVTTYSFGARSVQPGFSELQSDRAADRRAGVATAARSAVYSTNNNCHKCAVWTSQALRPGFMVNLSEINSRSEERCFGLLDKNNGTGLPHHVPPFLTVPAGQNSVKFTSNAAPIGARFDAAVTAYIDPLNLSAPLKVLPSGSTNSRSWEGVQSK
jgi:hypothetical protein